MPETPYHVPVMRDAVVALLDPQPGRVFVDATLGGAGHAAALAAHLTPGGRLIGLDQDPDALAEAAHKLAPFADVVTLAQGAIRHSTTDSGWFASRGR